ncbi:MAG: hypothetical protein J6T15_05970 [Bacilli bacterium]|nr:hypothetical protein [Bacilli bacterium]
MSKLFKRVSGITLGLALCFGFSFSCSSKSSSQMARATAITGTKVTDYTKIESGTNYYIGATVSSTDYLLQLASLDVKTGVAGTSTTDMDDATIFTFIGSGASWKLQLSNGNYMTLASSKNNGKVNIQAEEDTWTASNVSGLIQLKVNNYVLQKNSGNSLNFGSYASGQKNVWLLPVSTGDSTKLATPSPVYDKTNNQITWADVEHAESYDLVLDGGSVVHNATSPYALGTLEAGITHNVSVTAIGDGTNYTDSSAGTVNFGVLTHSGTSGDPYTVADAKLAIDTNDGVNDVYAKGIVSKIVTAYDSGYQNITFDISDDGTTTSQQLRGYRTVGTEGFPINSEDSIKVGDIVILHGNLTKYGDVYEFIQGNQLVNLVDPSAKELDCIMVSGSLTKTSYLTNEAWNPSGITVTAIYMDESLEDVTSKSTWSYNYNTPADMGVTEGTKTLEVYATFKGETEYLTFEVSVEDAGIKDTYHLSGRKYIFEQTSAESDPLYMNIDNAGASAKPAAVSAKGSASIFLFTLVGDDTYTITNLEGTKGLYHPGSGNTVSWGANGKDYQWKVDDTKVTKTVNNEPLELYGSYNFVGKDSDDNNRYLCSYNGSDWRTYGSADAGNRTAMIQVETAKEISGFSVDTTNAIKNVLKGTTFDAQAAADAGFVAQIDYTDGTHDPITTGVTWTLETSIVTSEAVLIVSYQNYDDVEITGMNIYAPTMVSLSIDTTTNGVKTSYFVGDNLDVSGVIVKAYDSGNNEYDIEVSQCTFSPENGATLTSENTEVTVSYVNEDNSIATGSYPISVNVFSGFTKVTSADDLEVGATYVVGVDTTNPTYRLMGETADTSGAKTYRNAVEASSVMSTDATRVADTAPTLVGASRFTLLKNAEGQYAFYDLGNSKYLTGYTNNGDNHLNDSASFGDASWWSFSFSSNVMSATLSGTDRVLAYNYNSGNDPRFATYGGYSANISHIALFKMDGSAVKDNVVSFTNDWLKMNDDYYAGDNETPECSENYAFLKIAYSELSDAEKNVFQYADDFAPARARLNNWATANGQVFTYGNDEPFASLRKTGVSGDVLSADDDSSLIILFLVCTLGGGALSAFYLMKKKKRA